MEVFPQSLKQSMTLRICKDSKNHQELVCFVISYGLIRLKTKKDNAPKGFSKMMYVDALISLDNKQLISSFTRINCCQY